MGARVMSWYKIETDIAMRYIGDFKICPPVIFTLEADGFKDAEEKAKRHIDELYGSGYNITMISWLPDNYSCDDCVSIYRNKNNHTICRLGYDINNNKTCKGNKHEK